MLAAARFLSGAANWAGCARLSGQGEGRIVLFKNDSDAKIADVKLPVYPDGNFRVRTALPGEAWAQYSGAQRQRGVEYPFPAASQVEIPEIRP